MSMIYDRLYSLRRYKNYVKDKKITIYEPVNILNPSTEQYEKAFKSKYKNIWAYVRQYMDEEKVESGAEVYTPEFMFIINHKSDLTHEDVVRYKDKVYNIILIDTFEGNKSDLVVIAREKIDS